MRKKIRTKILITIIVAICLIVIGHIGNNKAAPEPNKARPLFPAYENTVSVNKGKFINPNEQQKDQQIEVQNEPQNEQANATPVKDPSRAQPGQDNFLVKVSIAQQKVFVEKNGKIIRTITCSTGLSGKETPLGRFKINNYYGLNFYNNKYEQGANYWVGFKKAVYLFHSVPVDKNGNIIDTEADKLGTPASHGCIRMSMNDAFWFYETVPEGADVTIQ